MPDPIRLQQGNFDDPPATEEPFVPRRSIIRRSALPRASQTTSDMPIPTPPSRPGEMSSVERRRLGIIGSTSRRRRRSDSDQEDETQLDSPGTIGEERRRKRRRFQSPPPVPKRTPIKYGYYGQVEPGRLQLELVSCDGGEHRDQLNTGISLGPENVLRYDKSVYCSEHRSSTIVIRHADDNAFTLEKLHIVAPEHGFTAPVKAGVVHVAMNIADLNKYHDSPPSSRREDQPLRSPPRRYTPTSTYYPHPLPPRSSSIQASPERLSLADALNDPEVNAAFADAEREYRNEDDSASPGPSIDPRTREYLDAYVHATRRDGEPICDPPTPTYLTGESAASRDTEHRGVALSFDEEPGPEETSSQEIIDFRLQRLRSMRRQAETASFERLEERWNSRGAPSQMNARYADRYRSASSRMEETFARTRLQDDSPLDGMPSEEELMERMQRVQEGKEDRDVTTGRFFISRGRTNVTLKFDPPVSGRFIMLRVWSGKKNVDVQAVIAKGFSGPRFFPATALR